MDSRSSGSGAGPQEVRLQRASSQLGLRGRLANYAPLRRLLTLANLAEARLKRGAAVHPLDRAHRVETQAHLPAYLSKVGGAADAHLIPYAGCVASAVRHAVGTLPLVDGWTFLDLGCGKGRALIVASEAPFREVRGVELLPELVAVARRNARRIRRTHPDRPPITVQVGDASRPEWPRGPVVVFLYHPFDAPLVMVLKAHILEHAVDEVFVIYENPVHGTVFDGDASFTRWFSAMLDYEADEIGLGFDACESVLIWRLDRTQSAAARPCADLAIRTVIKGFRVVLVPPVPGGAQRNAAAGLLPNTTDTVQRRKFLPGRVRVRPLRHLAAAARRARYWVSSVRYLSSNPRRPFRQLSTDAHPVNFASIRLRSCNNLLDLISIITVESYIFRPYVSNIYNL